MLDWIVTNKEWVFSGIGVVIVVAVVQFAIRYLRTWRRTSQSAGNNTLLTATPPAKPAEFELLPHSFEVWLHQEIPHIEIWLYIVNHLSKELLIQTIRVDYFNFSGGPSLENIPVSGDVGIPPHQSRHVLFRRPLVDSEARAIERAQQRNPSNATFSITVDAVAGRKHFHQRSRQLSANGWIYNITSIS